MIVRQLVHNGAKYQGYSDAELKELGIPDTEIVDAINKQMAHEVKVARLDAYRLEADPLYMEWQYDQTPERETAWRAKVAEIKARYPLPENTAA